MGRKMRAKACNFTINIRLSNNGLYRRGKAVYKIDLKTVQCRKCVGWNTSYHLFVMRDCILYYGCSVAEYLMFRTFFYLLHNYTLLSRVEWVHIIMCNQSLYYRYHIYLLQYHACMIKGGSGCTHMSPPNARLVVRIDIILALRCPGIRWRELLPLPLDPPIS